MPNPYLLPSAPPDVLIPTTAGGTPTTFRLGAWAPLTDSFTAHSSSPTGAIIDLNDGLTWSLVEEGGGDQLGTALEWGYPQPTVFKSSNPRTVGERITKKNYQTNRAIKARLMLGQMLTYSGFITALHNLVQTLEGISPTNPGALQIQVVQAGSPVYADVLEAHIEESTYKEILWAQLLDDGILVAFECRPFLRGPRQTLQNYAVNPGFEAPTGGAGVPVFSDTFANTNAYAVQSGGAPTLLPSNTYVDIVAANVPSGGSLLRYYRLDEASGTSAHDIAGTGDTGTITGSGVTYGVTGALSGDTDTAMTFTTSGNVQATSATNMPTGSAACSLVVWVNCAATPGALGVALSIGDWTSNPYLAVTSAGKAEAGVTGIATVDSVATPFTAAGWHMLALTYAGGTGGTVTLYVDGASAGTFTGTAATAYTNNKSVTISTNQGNTHPLAASIDDPCVFSGALSGAQVTAIYNAGHTGATGTLASAMTIPNGGRVAFGSPAWGAMNTWQVRFRFLSGNTSRFHLHFTDASNFLFAQVTGSALTLNQTIAGTNHVLGTVAVTMVHEGWYWIECTQFPRPTSTTVIMQTTTQATLHYDMNGQPGGLVATTANAVTFDSVTALLGRPQLQASTGALTMGGAFSSTQQPTHGVSLFGPGGWWLAGDPATYSPSSGAWDGDSVRGASGSTGNTYTGGPVTSLGCARVDCVPVGTVSAYWQNANTSSTANVLATAFPAVASNTYGLSVYVKSSGVGSGCSQYLALEEYDSGGNFLREDVIQTATGAQVSWTLLSGSVAIGNTCAYVVLALRVQDANGGNPSANGIVWWDNALLWNQTSTGQSTMPWCDLRGPLSPYQVVVSGIKGDVPAPCLTQIGTNLTPASAIATSENLFFYLGQRASVSATTVLCGKWMDLSSFGNPPFLPSVLDASGNSSAGWYGLSTPGQTGMQVWLDAYGTGEITATGQPAANAQGTYHLFGRLSTTDATLTRVTTQPTMVETNALGLSAGFVGATLLTPFSKATSWNIVDFGQVRLPLGNAGVLRDLTQIYDQLSVFALDSNGTQFGFDWWCLLPVDAGAILGASAFEPTQWGTGWMWTYFDGISALLGTVPMPTFNTGAAASINGNAVPAAATSITGTVGANTQTLFSNNSPYLLLDPTQLVGTTSVNQFVGFIADQSQQAWPVLPLNVEFQYVPLYLYPT